MYTYFKRFLDFSIATIILIILSPLLLIASVLIRINMGKPILLRQMRPGKNEKIFTVYRFRTMRDTHDKNGKLLPDAERLTQLGKFIRTTSIDELPQMFNVLKGDMSLIGPRPLLVEYLPLYNARQRRRHEVRPGISGLAQVNGRNAISWEEKFEYDVQYVENFGFMMDLKIFFQTILNILKRKNISAAGEATMHKFTGNQ